MGEAIICLLLYFMLCLFQKCSFDQPQHFSLILLAVLINFAPYGCCSSKMIHLICSSIDPRQLSKMMSEIVRENIVLFASINVLDLLTESLKWDSMEQFMLWQLVQIEAVEFDKFLELL